MTTPQDLSYLEISSDIQPLHFTRPARLDNPEFIAEFWRRVMRIGECWVWTASHNRGYGELCCDGRVQGAHRVSWQITNGPIPKGMHILHHCDNPPCVNPAHLFLGTNYDNVLDKIQKGRHPKGAWAAQYSNPKRGEDNWHSKYTDEDVLKIRSLYANGTRIMDIAVLFRSKRNVINMIVHGSRWAHLPGALPTHRIIHFADQVKEMKESGMTQMEIARQLGFSQTAISRMVRTNEQ